MTKGLVRFLVVCGVLSLGAGCVTPRGSDFTAQIDDMLSEWKDAFLADDVDRIVSFYAEDFESPEYGNKEAFNQYMAMNEVRGFFPRMEFDFSERNMSLSQGRHGLNIDTVVTVSPINIEVEGQRYELNLTLEPRWGKWKIIRQSGGGGR
jgi:hypothetical protein